MSAVSSRVAPANSSQQPTRGRSLARRFRASYNPDLASLDLLLTARGDASYTIHLTYAVEDFAEAYDRKGLQKVIDGARGKKYRITTPGPKKGIVL